ncbi:MAG: ferredoxin--NADP reductase [Candidatus Electronema sp. V4]|uniref:ferredoxin--NADP reductase n=1 Tax=Candidatus Electronema sp. V4 TaxID=3454756 RepID=UPI00405598AA
MATELRFMERIVRTQSAVSYRFSCPPGFAFAAGQYMLLWPEPGGSLVHPLSFSDGPDRDFVEFTKRMTGSAYCQVLERLRPGDMVMAKGPLGHFSAEGIAEDIVCIAGGIGITPIRSILADMAQRLDPRPVTLIYGNADETDIAFAEELAALPLPQFRLAHVLQKTDGRLKAYAGLISTEIIRAETQNLDAATFLLSGPPVMVKAVETQLAGLSISPEQIRTDRFLGYA